LKTPVDLPTAVRALISSHRRIPECRIMKASMLVALVLSTLATAVAAQESARTREDVLRELAEARRTGDTIIAGCGGGTLREAFPNKYPAPEASRPAVAGRAAERVADAERRTKGPVER
jgi:hypothetical protein